MNRMRMRAACVAAALVCTTIAAAQDATNRTTDDGVTPRPTRVELLPPNQRSLEPAPAPLPSPSYPTPMVDRSAIPLEFVGLTSESYPGDRGVLNYSLACQRLFPGSRMCSASEISSTINIPRIDGAFHAWVQPGEFPQALQAQNCEGWMSATSGSSGLAFAVDTNMDCYGGFVTKPCDQLLAVACCAVVAGN